jgi:hypothetical protein
MEELMRKSLTDTPKKELENWFKKQKRQYSDLFRRGTQLKLGKMSTLLDSLWHELMHYLSLYAERHISLPGALKTAVFQHDLGIDESNCRDRAAKIEQKIQVLAKKDPFTFFDNVDLPTTDTMLLYCWEDFPLEPLEPSMPSLEKDF